MTEAKARPSLTPQQKLWKAHEVARTHGLYITEQRDKVGEHYYTTFIVYRANPGGMRGTRLGKRRDPGDLLRFVKEIAGVKDTEQDEAAAGSPATT